MSLLSWWRQSREGAAAARRSNEINEDQEVIAYQVPELAYMDTVAGMAYTMQQIGLWNQTCTQEQVATFAGRLIASQEVWKADGLTMPYWGNLWVLRNYQAELGQDVPTVAPPFSGD